MGKDGEGLSVPYMLELVELLETKQLLLRCKLITFIRHHHDNCLSLGSRHAKMNATKRDSLGCARTRPDLDDDLAALVAGQVGT
jgi:hypothetical protein